MQSLLLDPAEWHVPSPHTPPVPCTTIHQNIIFHALYTNFVTYLDLDLGP